MSESESPPRQERPRRGEMPFLDHLEELRWRILWSGVAIVVGTLVGFVLAWKFGLLDLLMKPALPFLPEGQEKLTTLSPTDPFFITLKLGLAAGLIMAFPVVLYQAWAFLSPALEDRERKVIIPALYFGMLLFAGGALMAYYLALPFGLSFFQGFQVEYLETIWEVNKYMAFVVRLLVGFGLVFELPVVVMILSVLGLVTPEWLSRHRRYAIVILTIVASLLSPGDILVVTALMMIPLYLLYEISIVLSRIVSPGRRQEENRIGGAPPPDGSVEA